MVRVGSSVARAASVSAAHDAGGVEPAQVHRHALARVDAWSRFSPCTCTPRIFARRSTGQQPEVVALGDPAAHERAGHDGAEALHRERHGRPAGARRRRRGRAGTSRTRSRSASRSASSPSPVFGGHRTIGASLERRPGDQLARRPGAPAPASRRPPGPPSSGRRCPRGTPSSRQMSKCSRVCGITDSSAATTSITASMPPAPASMFFTNRSWPGTSTNASVRRRRSQVREPEIDGDAARLLFLSRSGSVPVSASTSALLP